MLDDCQPPDGVQIDILILSSGNIEDDEDIIDCSEQQKAEGELPFDNIPEGEKDVQIFDHMQKTLISLEMTISFHLH